MKPDALIFVGPAEGGILLSPRLQSAGIALAFGFRKRVALERPARRELVGVAALPPVTLPGAARQAGSVQPAASAASSRLPFTPGEAAVSGAASPSLLEQARLLADQGQLAQAAALCEQAIGEQGASAEAFYLQGLIHDADGDAELAQRCYRKVLYLEPQHQAALLHLAALLQATGDAAGAERMRQRAGRVSPAEENHRD